MHLKVSVENISDLERRMTVQVPAERVDEAVEERLKSLRPRTKVDGFRPGTYKLKARALGKERQ